MPAAIHHPKRSARKSRLPSDFVPSPCTVICGRGKPCSASPGNKFLRSQIRKNLTRYSMANNKKDKSAIVSTIIGIVRETSPQGAFVKEGLPGEWWEVEDSFAREKIGCIFRDMLHQQYRSSTKAKHARKKAEDNRRRQVDKSLSGNIQLVNGRSTKSSERYFPERVISEVAVSSPVSVTSMVLPTRPTPHAPRTLAQASFNNEPCVPTSTFDAKPVGEGTLQVEPIPVQSLLPRDETAHCNVQRSKFRPKDPLRHWSIAPPQITAGHVLTEARLKRNCIETRPALSLLEDALHVVDYAQSDTMDDFPDNLSDIFDGAD